MRPQTYDCYAITPPGEESITARELLALGIDPRASEPGGVSFRTDAGGIGRANVELRTASRVIVRVATCHASAFHELERRGDRLPWEACVPPGRSVAFRVYFPKVEALPSGTIPIEAALLARRIAPGLRRTFACEQWAAFPRSILASARSAAQERILSQAPAPILGSDRDAGAIDAASENAERAGVLESIQLRKQAISALESPLGLGFVVTNPPYGIRVGRSRDLRDLYAQLGKCCDVAVPDGE